jgi:hypothetical protein
MQETEMPKLNPTRLVAGALINVAGAIGILSQLL